MRKRYASSTDVANLAGVSQSTVSRCFRGDTKVSPEVKARVIAAAEKLAYRPNLLPRIMLTEQSRIVAFVTGGLHNPFYSRVLEEFIIRLQDIGCQVMAFHVNGDDTLDAVAPKLSGYRVDAIVSALSVLTDAALEQFTALGVPLISFNTHLQKKGLYSISSDNVLAGQLAARHLIEQGGGEVAFLGGPANNPANIDRCRGFTEESLKHGKTPIVLHDEFSFAGGVRQAMRLLEIPKIPDAIFCADDLIAIGLMDTFWRTPVKNAPDVLRIIGCDDIPQSAWAPYDLTTIQQDENAMIDRAISILESMYADTLEEEEGQYIVKCHMVLRSSTHTGVYIPRP